MTNSADILKARIAYYQSLKPDNTKLALERVVKQYLSRGFPLPAQPDDVCAFLLEKADGGAKISTLRNYCAMLVRWHVDGNHIPLATAIKIASLPLISGINRERANTGQKESRDSAAPLLVEDALKIDAYLVAQLDVAQARHKALAHQDLCLFRLLWWSGCRESEVVSLRRWQVSFHDKPRGLTLNWTVNKTNKASGTGTSRFIPSLPSADPYTALMDWLGLYWPSTNTGNPEESPLFVRQARNGEWLEKPMHPNSIPRWLRRIAAKAGVQNAESLSGHSPRHGLATMMSNHVELREVMDYFKWKSPETAVGYITNKGVSQNVIDTLSQASLMHEYQKRKIEKIAGEKLVIINE